MLVHYYKTEWRFPFLILGRKIEKILKNIRYTLSKEQEVSNMEGLELVCFQIITFAGDAKSSYMGAIQKAKQGCYEEAENMIKEGSEAFLNAHKVHADLIQKEASGDVKVMPNILLIHAEDQLMGAETCKIMAIELIDAYKRIEALEKKSV